MLSREVGLIGGTSAERQRARMRSGDAVREVDLVARLRQRDVRAFEVLYAIYRPKLRRFLSNLIRRPHLVEEVVSDTMMVVWERIDGFKGDSSLSTWIFAIAYRKARRAMSRADEPVSDDERRDQTSDAPNPEDAVGNQHKRSMLLRALNALSADHRAVVDLTYFQELSYREIAEVMACPVDTVKTRMFHARRHLKRILAGNKVDWL